MSTVLLRREQPPVCFEAVHCGIEFAHASADVQKEFLLGWFLAADGFPWAIQCRAIIDEMNDYERSSVASVVETLLEHLREPVSEPASV